MWHIPFDAFWTLQLSGLRLSGQLLLGALFLAAYAGLFEAASFLHEPLRPLELRVLVRRAGTREAYCWARYYLIVGCAAWCCGS